MASYVPKRHSSDRAKPSDSELALSTSNFEEAFDQLVVRHYGALCTFALRLLQSPDAAEDAVQEVLAKVWNCRTTADLRDPVPYLYRAVRNQCLMELRRERRWHTVDIQTSDSSRLVAPEQGEIFELQDAIAQAIDVLPERTRLVFTMHRQQDLTYTDIARVLGISVKTVETQMTRALRMLRHRLDKFFPIALVTLFRLIA